MAFFIYIYNKNDTTRIAAGRLCGTTGKFAKKRIRLYLNYLQTKLFVPTTRTT